MNRLDGHDVRVRISDADLARIPRTGALVVAGNPLLETAAALALAQSLLRVRADVRVLADDPHAHVAGLGELVLMAHTRRRAGADVGAGLQPALDWLAAGGVLVVLPATKALSFDMLRRGVVTQHWRRIAAELVRRSQADVLPVYVSAGARQTMTMRAGSVLPHKRLARIERDEELTAYLRHRVHLLSHRAGDLAPLRRDAASHAPPKFRILFPLRRRGLPRAEWPPVAAPVSKGLLAAEAEKLAPGQTLVENDEYCVRVARAWQVPHTLREIGRLRELTFRTVGEGTGKVLDLDQFDEHYLHLWLWHRERQEIAGAYRIGPTDELLPHFGLRGLYTSTVFKFHPSLIERVSPALEMGRSFVCAEFQKSFAPLMLLWRGIGHFIVQNPRYRFLFGPVSISNEYQQFSRQLMIEFLRKRHALPRLARWVKPRLPFRTNPFLPRTAPAACAVLHDVDELSAWVAEIEPNAAGVPILIKHYLKLGGKVLAFNVDPNFSNVVDGLILVDLTAAERPTLDRYMGRDGAAAFLNLHRRALPLAG